MILHRNPDEHCRVCKGTGGEWVTDYSERGAPLCRRLRDACEYCGGTGNQCITRTPANGGPNDAA